MIKRLPKILAAALITLMVAGLSACGGAPSKTPAPEASKGAAPVKEAPAASKPPVDIKLHVPAKSVNFLPFYVGVEKGIYEKHGFRLSIQDMKADIGVSALTSGEIQYSASIGTVLRAAMQGVPLKNIAYVVKDPTFQLYGQPSVKGISELKGKPVGVTSIGGTDAYSARAIIKKGGLNPDQDIVQVALGPTANILAALEGKSVQAGILSPPFGPMAQQKGYVLLGEAIDAIKIPQSGLGTTALRIKEKPEEVKRMILATLESIKYSLEHKDEVVRVIMKEWRVDEKTAIGSYDIVSKALSPDGSIDPAVILSEIAEAKITAKIQKDFTVEEVTDFTLLKEAQKQFKK